jgi:hypothetical protein
MAQTVDTKTTKPQPAAAVPIQQRTITKAAFLSQVPLDGFGDLKSSVVATPGLTISLLPLGVLVDRFGKLTLIPFSNVASVTFAMDPVEEK